VATPHMGSGRCISLRHFGARAGWSATPSTQQPFRSFRPSDVYSVLGVPVFLSPLVIPILAYRALKEERLLDQELEGYADYMKRVRHRLIPCVW